MNKLLTASILLVISTIAVAGFDEHLTVTRNIGIVMKALGDDHDSPSWDNLYGPIRARMGTIQTPEALERFSRSVPFCEYHKDSGDQSHLTFEFGLPHLTRFCADGIDVFVHFGGKGEKLDFQHHHEDVQFI